jgi:transcriptional regulator with XRE-family HTH domain
MLKNEAFLKALGKRIDEIRKEKGISFQDLAYKSEIEKSNLVKLASQGSNITTISLLKISKALNVPLSQIFDFEYGLKDDDRKSKS